MVNKKQDIYGPRFKCSECNDFDYCFMCKYTSEQKGLHPDHGWKCIEPADEKVLIEEFEESDVDDDKDKKSSKNDSKDS